MIIGIDDTDSVDGMCTTYLTAVLIEQLRGMGTIKGMPYLIRLNPNIKYKTRGNAALSLKIDANPGSQQRIMDTAVSLVDEMADVKYENTNPGIVFLSDEVMQDREFKHVLEAFMWRAIRDVLTIEDARIIIDRFDLAHQGFKNGRGLIGALAASGAAICGLPDHTYEMIAYRKPENFGTSRVIDHDSVFKADKITYPNTWDTVDIANNTVVFAPHSPDPVLFGIRGDNTQSIQQAFNMIESEKIGRTILYMTNQGTDLHLLDGHICDIIEHRSYYLTGVVLEHPRTIEGGHTFFTLAEKAGTIECSAFEPTKDFRQVVRQLMPGDRVKVYGSVQNGTLNLEKIDIIELSNQDIVQNPLCPSCGRRMKSAGHSQGFRCRRCGTSDREVSRNPVRRSITPGIYEVPPCARRHISLPLVRSSDPRAFPSR
ncbi:MAG: tRNA(Ile)(2)-agmatinylcytidine synthase [ANME-2 cluster archaeon]|nr:tRNA(Ile)(2)-agmatinylcytidine synthase [ANME-2 cluster archaeon]